MLAAACVVCLRPGQMSNTSALGGAAGPALEALLYATRSLHQGRNMAQRCRVVLKNFLAGLMSRALSGAQGGRVKHALSGVWRKAGRSGIKQRSGIE